VIIPSYRTDWLPGADHDFIRAHYVALADDFWVLGSVLSRGQSTFKIIHAGRYRISAVEDSNLAGSGSQRLEDLLSARRKTVLAASIDGQPLAAGPIELTVGTHRIETSADCEIAIVWAGPAGRAQRLAEGDHRRLFFNWY